jgi:hypothetical protein
MPEFSISPEQQANTCRQYQPAYNRKIIHDDGEVLEYFSTRYIQGSKEESKQEGIEIPTPYRVRLSQIMPRRGLLTAPGFDVYPGLRDCSLLKLLKSEILYL